MLKNSARNCRLTRSVIAVFLSAEKSTVVSPGPVKTSRPTLPYVPFGGTSNALGLKYWLGPPRVTGPEKAGFQEGRTGLRESPSLDGLKPSCGVKGKPVCAVTTPAICQPPTSVLTSRDGECKKAWPLPNG